MSKEVIAIIGFNDQSREFIDAFSHSYRIWIYDPYYVEDNHVQTEVDQDELGERVAFTNNRNQVNGCDLAMVCVPTERVEHVFEWLNTPLMLVCSLVSVGTVDYLIEEYGNPNVACLYIDERLGKMYLGGELRVTDEVVDFFVESGFYDTLAVVQADARTVEDLPDN